MTIDKALALTPGEPVIINYNNTNFEKINVRGMVSHVEPTIHVNHHGKQYIWVTVEYRISPRSTKTQRSTFASHHIN